MVNVGDRVRITRGLRKGAVGVVAFEPGKVWINVELDDTERPCDTCDGTGRTSTVILVDLAHVEPFIL